MEQKKEVVILPKVDFCKIEVEKLPEISELEKADINYKVMKSYVIINIRWDDSLKELVYRVNEPLLVEDEEKMLEAIKEKIIDTIDINLKEASEEDSVNYLLKKVFDICLQLDIVKKTRLTKKEKEKDEDLLERLSYYVLRDFIGMGKIEALLRDPYIEDLSCDGVNVNLFVLHSKYGPLRTNVTFKDNHELNSFVMKLAQRCGKYVSFSQPYIDGRLPDGSRVNLTFEHEITTRGSTFTIRKFSRKPLTPLDLVKNGTISEKVAAYYWYAVETGVSILVAGSTASGKTTFLNAISFFIPPNAKVISIEDTRELNLPVDNWVPAVERVGYGPADKSGRRYGEVTMFELLKESFRQNPDYVIVGEVRGEEASVLFQGMASGHACFGTIHADSIKSVVRRLQLPPINLQADIIDNLDIFTFLLHIKTKKGESRRVVKTVEETTGVDEKNELSTHAVFSYDPTKDEYEENHPFKSIVEKCGLDIKKVHTEIAKREEIIKKMLKNNFTTEQFVKFVHDYYKFPEKMLHSLK
ncbi:MAG: type II/IV secretion system ATPase subunit [Candidatus Woesearchaeota archaeon]